MRQAHLPEIRVPPLGAIEVGHPDGRPLAVEHPVTTLAARLLRIT